MSALDRLIGWLSPAWLARRELARYALRQARLVGYREGRPTRLDPRIEARGASPDWSLELGFDRREIVDRARQLERDNALACSLLDRSVEHVVGEGFLLKVKTADSGFNRAAEEWWAEESRKLDSRGLLSFPEILAATFRSWLRDGDVACVLEQDGKVRMVESDEIASPRGGHHAPSDVDGVELDRRGRIQAFTIFDWDPTVLWPDRRFAIPRLIRVPAGSVVFLARRQRLNQTRGLSAFTGITWLLEQLDEALEAVAVAHRMAACFGLFVKKKAPIPGARIATSAQDVPTPELDFEPGMVLRLDPDEDAGQIAPEHPTGTFEMLVSTLIRFAGARFGLPLEIVNYDFSRTNYSNARAAALEASRATRIKQGMMLRGFCSALWGWKLANAIRRGDLPPREDAGRHQWDVPGSAWIDPQVEVQAAMASIDGALDTRTKVLARRGLDFEEVARELADERKILAKLGLPDVRGNMSRDAVEVRETIKEGEPLAGRLNGAARR